MESYDASSIQVLKGLEAVKKRPGMYIGDTDDGTGLHHMVYEVVDNAVDEFMGGHCEKILITLHKDGWMSVEDDGRGIPIDLHKEEGVSAAEVIMTRLHAGGKFDHSSYKISGGLHGVGVSVVNALSSKLMLFIFRDGKEYFISFQDGVPDAPLKELNATNKRGTKISFLPSDKTFSHINFNFDTLKQRLQELAFLNSNLEITLEDLRTNKKEVMHHKGGIESFIKYLDQGRTALLKKPINISHAGATMKLDASFQWNDSYNKEKILVFTNNIRQKDGGTHLSAFKSALTRTINSYIENSKLSKNTSKLALTGEDTREGLTAVLSLHMPDPRFSSQTKDKLISSEVRSFLEPVLNDEINSWLEENPKEAQIIYNKVLEAAISRESARKARELARKKIGFGASPLPGKLADCQMKKPEKCELLLVEGDSAGGSVKQGRDRAFQAVLPLRGKILNVERVRLDKLLCNNEISALTAALGTSIGHDKFNVEEIRYHTIVIMTDADVDGAHIKTLILTFFYRQMEELIRRGYLYIAQPPLYKVKQGRKEFYIKNDKELQIFFLNEVKKHSEVKYPDGTSLTKPETAQLIDQAALFQRLSENIAFSYSLEIICQMLISDTFQCEILNDKKMQQRLVDRLQSIDSENEWSIEETNGKIFVKQSIRGVDQVFKIDSELFTFEQMDGISQKIDFSQYDSPMEVLLKNKTGTVNSPTALMDFLMEIVREGIHLQRYKGLGEMNPDQLWDTTLNPEVRTLLKVTINQAEEADKVFSRLMGSEPHLRRQFIEENALKVANLDV